MFGIATLLSVLVAATSPNLSDAEKATRLAVEYLAEACHDGNEHVGIYTPSDGIFRDLTTLSEIHSANWNEEALMPLCEEKTLYAFHCHTTNDHLSLFPGIDFNSGVTDFGFAANLEYICQSQAAEHGFMPPMIQHRLVHTGGANTVVRYGLSASLEMIQSLGAGHGRSRHRAGTVSLTDPNLTSFLSTTVEEGRSLSARIQAAYDELNSSYGKRITDFMLATCPIDSQNGEFVFCDKLTLNAFIKTLDPCDPFFIMKDPYAQPPSCHTGGKKSADKQIIFEPRYSGFTELTPETYDSFTANGKVLVAFCGDTSDPMNKTCDDLIPKLQKFTAQCPSLKTGFVDTNLYPELRRKHEIDQEWIPMILLDNGARFTIKIGQEPSPQLFGLIVCGLEINNPLN